MVQGLGADRLHMNPPATTPEATRVRLEGLRQTLAMKREARASVPRRQRGTPIAVQAGSARERPIGHTWSYLAFRNGHLVSCSTAIHRVHGAALHQAECMKP
jgi:hypothetical protein